MKIYITRLLFVAFVFLLPLSAQAQLMSLYQFDSNLSDTVRGAGGAGTVLAGSNNYSYVPGIIGSALSITGSPSSGTLIRAPQAGAGLSAYTISAWVNFDTSTPWGTIVKNWGAANAGAYHFGLNDNSDKIGNYIGTSSGVSAVEAPSTITTDVWTHAAVTFGGGFQTLFINGVAVATNSDSGTVNNNFAFMSFGGKLNDAQTGIAGGNPGWLDGTLDEVAFFNTNLSSSQIAGIYTAGTNGQSVTTLGYSSQPYVDPSAAVPEPGTWAAAALLVGGAGYVRWRRRKVS